MTEPLWHYYIYGFVGGLGSAFVFFCMIIIYYFVKHQRQINFLDRKFIILLNKINKIEEIIGIRNP